MRFSVTEPAWRADEELRLLHALHKLGIGNWDVVATQVNAHSQLPRTAVVDPHNFCVQVGNKTAEECEKHYVQFYLQSKTAPLPDVSWAKGMDDTGAGPADQCVPPCLRPTNILFGI